MTVAATAALLLSSCSGRTVFENRKPRQEDIPVRVMTVESVENTGTKSYVGTASASKSALLSCRYSGRLVSLNVQEGDFVKAGQVLAEVESQSVRTSYEMAAATLKQAEDGYARASKVYGSGSISDVKMVEVETRLSQARAAAEAAEKAIEECRIKAPFSGVVGDIMADEGVEVDPLDNILSLLDITSVKILFPVPENELGQMDKGDHAAISIPALGLGDVDAEITAKGIVASPLSHTYECTLLPVRKIPGLMPGMVVKVYIDHTGGSGVTVPASVIRTDMDGRYLWTVSDDNRVCKTYVTPDGFSGKGVIISNGLSIGDRVITEGVQKVCSGMKVRIVE